jgi:dTDP-4-dehydrorhamnose reductase
MIADISAQALRQRPMRSGTWHLTSTGETSWFGFAEAIIDCAQVRGLLARHPCILPITTADYPTPAVRPAYSVLDTTKLHDDFGLIPGAWQEELRNTMDVMAQVSPR